MPSRSRRGLRLLRDHHSSSGAIARLNARFHARFEFEDVISDVYTASARASPSSLLGARLRHAQPPWTQPERFVVA